MHAVGDEHLGAVEHVGVAVAARGGADALHVGAGVRLGHGDRDDLPARDDVRHVARLLRRRAGIGDVHRGHVGVHQHRDGEAAEGRAAELLARARRSRAYPFRCRRIRPDSGCRGSRARPCGAASSRGTKPCSSQASACGFTSVSTKRRTCARSMLVLLAEVGRGEGGVGSIEERAWLNVPPASFRDAPQGARPGIHDVPRLRSMDSGLAACAAHRNDSERNQRATSPAPASRPRRAR